MKARRINAFTIIEVTIAMLLTALTIGITYSDNNIVAKTYKAYSAKNENITKFITLDHILRRDFDRADTILKDSAGVALKISSTIIKYKFFPNYIIRESSKIDTFKLQAVDPVTAFESLPINDMGEQSESNCVDELYFKLIVNNDTVLYHYRKLYSSENLINRNPDAVN